MVKIIQPSLAGGEVSSAIGARVDVDKYKSSLETCENAFVQKQFRVQLPQLHAL